MNQLLTRTSIRTALVLALAAGSAAAQSLLSQHGEVLIGAGDPAPGIAGCTIYNTNTSGIDTPVLDRDGYVVFRARLLGAVSALDDRAIFAGYGAGDLQLVVRAGDQAPGLAPGILLRSGTSGASGPNSNVQVSPSGQFVYFSSTLSDDGASVTTADDSAVFWGPVGGLVPVAREGDQVPFLAPGVLYGSLSSFSRQYNKINSTGMITMPCQLTGAVTTSDDSIVIGGLPGALETILREGDPAGPNGEIWVPQSGTTMSFTIMINDNGQVLLAPRLGGTATTANDSTLAVWTPGSGVAIFAREGDQAPGMAAGVLLTGGHGQGSNAWNNSGNTAFTWAVDDGGVTITADNNQVLFYGGLAGVQKVAQEGDVIGLPGGERFGVFNNSSVTSNEAGTIAFFCSLRDAAGQPLPTTNDSAMLIGTAAGWTELVREGDPIAAIPPSVNGPWTCGNVTGTANLNSRGQLLFNQSATDGVETRTFFLLYDPELGMQVMLDGTEVYTTTIGTGAAVGSTTSAGAFSGGDGSPAWFNNHGDLVFRQSLDNGLQAALVKGHSGALIATPSSLSVTNGGTHTFTIDAGPARASNFYAVLGTQAGTRPGTVLPPLGPLNIPLNFDAWTQVSIGLFNSPVYSNTLWFTDANGRGSATFNLPPATGIGTFLLHHAFVCLDINLQETFVSEPAAVRIY